MSSDGCLLGSLSCLTSLKVACVQQPLQWLGLSPEVSTSTWTSPGVGSPDLCPLVLQGILNLSTVLHLSQWPENRSNVLQDDHISPHSKCVPQCMETGTELKTSDVMRFVWDRMTLPRVITRLSLNSLLLLQRPEPPSTTAGPAGLCGCSHFELTGRCAQKWSLTPKDPLFTFPTLFNFYMGANMTNVNGHRVDLSPSALVTSLTN